MKRLKDPAEALRTFLDRARNLTRALGPLLFQLPGAFSLDLERLDGFLEALARQHIVRELRVALEVRHPSWLVPTVIRRLRAAGVALCLADWPALPVTRPVTADFVSVRRHGSGALYGVSYPVEALRRDARHIRRWLREGRDVYAYFNNDQAAFPVRDARRLGDLVHPPRERRA